MIYFIQAPDGRVKIGTTIRLTQRLKALCREAGSELRVLAVIDGRHNVERELHRRFAHLRVVSEWFEPGDDLLGFIVQDGRPWDGSDDASKVNTSVVKVGTDIVAMAKMVAAGREISLTEYLTETLRSIVKRDLDSEYAKRNAPPRARDQK